MIKKINKLLNEIYINEESLESFVKNKYWINKLIKEAILEMKHANSDWYEFIMCEYVNEGYLTWDIIKKLLREIYQGVEVGEEELDLGDLDNPKDIFNYYDEEIIANTKVFEEFVYYYMEDRLYNIIDDIKDIIDNNGRIDLYRALEIKSTMYPYTSYLEREGKHLGIYWADSYDKAESYWGSGGFEYVLQVEVKENYVDWYETLVVLLDLTSGELEQEIRLFKGLPLKIKALYQNDTELNISSIEDKTFYA